MVPSGPCFVDRRMAKLQGQGQGGFTRQCLAPRACKGLAGRPLGTTSDNGSACMKPRHMAQSRANKHKHYPCLGAHQQPKELLESSVDMLSAAHELSRPHLFANLPPPAAFGACARRIRSFLTIARPLVGCAARSGPGKTPSMYICCHHPGRPATKLHVALWPSTFTCVYMCEKQICI